MDRRVPERPERLPFLEAISWFDADPYALAPLDMLSRYERGWRHRGVLADPATLSFATSERWPARTGACSMFRREVHRAIAPILAALDPGVLRESGMALGGATRIALALGEVRESADLDFIGSSATGYAELRQRVRERGVGALLRAGLSLELPREPTADQYGIRFPVRVGGRDVKVELVFEGRISLEAPVLESFSDVPCLSTRDTYAEKLLACSDRGADPSTLARDVVDLAILRERWGPIPLAAWAVAEGAYGASVRRDLTRALERFRANDDERARALTGLRVDDPDLVLRGVEALAVNLGLGR